MTDHQLIENASLDDVRPGDHLIWTIITENGGVTLTYRREGIAHDRDVDGDWRTAGGVWITDRIRKCVTLTIRRTVRELPTKLGAVIVPAPGHKTITATDPADGTVWRAREAARTGSIHWTGVWREEDGTVSSVMPGALIDADTWQEDSA